VSADAAVDTRKAKGADFLVPLGIIGIVLMMVLPLPAALLDLLLSCSMALAIGVFLTALFIESALEFSAFPAVVLVATLLRLSLNVATTRLILLHGGEGQGAAGSVVEAFGRFVVEGNVLVGLVVFLILAVINFIVVTKGAGRVAEVAARFTLDAMPGKQMAVDAEVSSGALTAEQARVRRKSLEREADFYGAMDGASKFVHGDAIAGLLITAINLVGGLILGVSRGMDVGTAAETFSVLSVGDALASQIPALLISAAAGIVVTRSATGDQVGRAFGAQLLGRRQPVMLTAGILTVLGLMPGMPTLPCILLAGSLAVVASRIRPPGTTRAASTKPNAAATDPKKSAMDVDAALSLDLLCLEVGYELVSLVDVSRGGTLLDRVASLRQQLARDLGVVMPPIHVCDNLELPPGAYRLLLSGNEVGRGTCAAGRLLAVDPRGTAPPIEGEKTLDPTFGMPARWITLRDKEMAEALGYTVVDHATVVATHLGELLRTNAHKLLGRQEVQHLLEVLSRTSPKVVDDVVPNLLPLGDVMRVLRNLVKEGVSVRDLRTILEALGEVSSQTKDVEQLTELVRERMAAHITSRVKGPDGKVAVLTLDPKLEDAFRRSLRDIATGAGGAIDPELLRAVAASAEKTLPKFTALSATPLVATSPDIRRYVRAVFERRLPQLGVLSFREIDPAATIHVLDRLVSTAAPLPQ
jgi:flagellar biosynthesis protein FlhA